MGVVSEAFKAHLELLAPDDDELEEAESHASSIQSRLSDSFDLKKFELVGSHARDSAISIESDADYFAVFARDEVRWGGSVVASTTFLNRIRHELMDRFTSTYVRKDGPAVVVHFSDGDFPVDVVPAYYLGPHQTGWPLYAIPDGTDGWMQTSPGYHNQYIGAADKRSKGRLHRVARLLKYWRGARTPSIPISSFHMEMVLAADAICEGATTHRACFEAALRRLRDRRASPLRDPLKVSGDIDACRTEAQRAQVLAALQSAADLARRASEAERRGDEEEACALWSRLFNGNFPTL
jgi:Second Messenger Oligonucleotide or Dinucleotide Synthetase domain